ncbi:MAG: hypothetical protein M1826_004349 [Phylliscum demangeonii]|nr:MAG: hypothetical protein M1826_004349 [Phylliscum demangeonii]
MPKRANDHLRHATKELGASTDEVESIFVGLSSGVEVDRLRYRVTLANESEEARSLGNGAEVTAVQDSPCGLSIKVGTMKPHNLLYPFPVDGSAAKLRVARKSSWVEVSVRLAPAQSAGAGGYSPNPFPVVLEDSHPNVWGLSRVDITRQPTIKIAGNKLQWVISQMGLTLSVGEDTLLLQPSSTRPLNALLDLKESLSVLFQAFVGLNETSNGKSVKVFRLVDNNDSDTIILVNAMCHDLNTGSIVLDAYVVPLVFSRLPAMLGSLQRLVDAGPLNIMITAGEAVMWKHAMPFLVERCRCTWSHRAKCEYRILQQIPLFTGHGESAICRCGEGLALDGFPSGPAYRGLGKYATRIAIPAISAVPFVEELASL